MKTKYPRTSHFDFSNSKTLDDKISNDCSILENKEIVINEKLDGQNSGFNKYDVYARSHAAPTELPWDKPIKQIHNRIKHIIGEDEFVFGESMVGIHSIEYKKLESYYYIFGIRVKDEWLCWDDVEDYAYCLDLPTVPVLFKGKTNDIKTKVLDLIKKPSMFDGYDIITGEETMEGVVCRNSNSFNNDNFNNNVLKMVRCGHVKTDEHWTRNWKKAKLVCHQ